jgi:hypothetical protein
LTREQLIELLTKGVSAKPEFIKGGLRLCHRPHVAPLAFLHKIFPVISANDVNYLEQQLGRPAPPAYVAFLTKVGNGAQLFGMDLFGFVDRIDRSMDGRLGQPISLRYGNEVERPNELADSDFGIGGISGWSSRGTLVMGEAGDVRLVHPVDGRDVAATWPSLDDMIQSEIARLSKLYDRGGKSLSSFTENMHPGGRKWEEKNEPRAH